MRSSHFSSAFPPALRHPAAATSANARTTSPLAQSLSASRRFLRDGGANDESRQLRASLGALADLIEAAVRARRLRRDTAAITRMAAALVQGVREHQWFLTGLGSAWHALYGAAAYPVAVAELLRAAQAWQQHLERRSRREGAAFDRMELLAWRTLGEALLLMDLYEQAGSSPSTATGTTISAARHLPAWRRVLQWWQRLRT